jgi:thiol-disulfide isomerase/thioredoxin
LLKTKNEKIIALLVGFLAFSCSNTKQKKRHFLKKLYQRLLATDGVKLLFRIFEKHEGKTMVIEMWASWCGSCVKAMPKNKELQANNQM